jgi:ring-1,2-phenylacetyl-CoA epoxidase subunit PaaC
MAQENIHFQYVLQLGDSALILAQRLGAWCGHGPILEQDIALSNIALDLIGQTRSLLTYAGSIEGAGRSEDDLAFLRLEREYRNVLLVEQPNGHWGTTIMRQFFFDTFQYYHQLFLVQSADSQLAAIAEKAIKETTYHVRFSSEWVIRLGDGTPESRARMLDALETLWPFTGELYTPTAADAWATKQGIGPDLNLLATQWKEKVAAVLTEATLPVPPEQPWQLGGKTGFHSEHLGHILPEMQYLQRVYPGAEW